MTFSSSVPALEVRSLLFTETVLACLHFCCSLYSFLVLPRSFRSLKLIEGGNPFLSVLFHGPLSTVLISAASAFHPGSTSMRLHRYGPRSEESLDFSSSFQMMNFLFFEIFDHFQLVFFVRMIYAFEVKTSTERLRNSESYFRDLPQEYSAASTPNLAMKGFLFSIVRYFLIQSSTQAASS